MSDKLTPVLTPRSPKAEEVKPRQIRFWASGDGQSTTATSGPGTNVVEPAPSGSRS